MILSHLLQAKSGILQKQNLIIAKKVSNGEPLDIDLSRYVIKYIEQIASNGEASDNV